MFGVGHRADEDATSIGGPSVKHWQIAAGADSRVYTNDFLRYGLAFVGGTKNIARLQRVRKGDRLILKRGKREIVAVGVAVERDGIVTGVAGQGGVGREWLHDYDGWDLPGFCCVEWHRSDVPRVVSGLGRRAVERLDRSDIHTIANDILQSTVPLAVEPEPVPTEPLGVEEMLYHLIRLGLRSSVATELTGTLERVKLLARYYYSNCRWEDVREHEARTFLIVPFLLALGWSEQQIKIELAVQKARKNRTRGGRIDIACFRRPYRVEKRQPNNGDCVLILESKGFSQGLDYAHGQGKEYAAMFPSCRVVVASNGYCYKAYRRKPDSTDFEDLPAAYLNLLRPTKRYSLAPDRVAGGLELLSFLLPQAGML